LAVFTVNRLGITKNNTVTVDIYKVVKRKYTCPTSIAE